MPTEEVLSDISGTVTLIDGSPTPVTLDLDFDAGDFTGGPFKRLLNETEVVVRRGRTLSLIPTNPIHPAGSFSCYLAEYNDLTDGHVVDFVQRLKKYANNVSTRGDLHVFTYDIRYRVTKKDGTTRDFTLHDCEIVMDTITEGQPTTLSFSWTCYGGVSGDMTCAEMA